MPNPVNDAAVQSPAFPLVQFLRRRGWRETTHESNYTRHFEKEVDGIGWQASIHRDARWYLSDWEKVAEIEGWFSIEGAESQGLDSLRTYLLGAELIEWECPSCGESGGQPVEWESRPYLYGADADGNRGEWRTDTEQMCSKCAPRGRR